ncbi:MAG: ABC transporter ATP-binding protein/permease [Alphaproteobacteria bacterium]|nr:ABC transporter ATP-binding protein/permease [Alphaproteobacteria bacterium]
MTAPNFTGRKMKARFAPGLLTQEPEVEALPEVNKGERVPGTPFGFLWFLVSRHYRGRLAAFVACVALATAIEAMSPYVLGRMINALTATVQSGEQDWSAVGVFVALFACVWYLPALIVRGAEAIDIYMSPRMRALAQKYLFAYLMGHSPRYFQENFAGKLGQKVKQAGQATVSLLNILAFECVRILVLLAVGGILLALQNVFYAALLFGWAVIYLSVVTWLARRCVNLSKIFSDEVSTSTGRLIDAIANADLVRAFARGGFERQFMSRYLADEMNASQSLRWFLIVMRIFMATAMLALLMGLIVLAIRDTLSGAITVGGFTMIFFLGTMIARSVQELSYRMLDFFEQLGTLAEALELVTQEHEIVDRPDAKPLAVRQGEIAFEDISFSHADGHPVFQGLNLRIKAGEKVGLVGKSGAGKSTLVKLLRRQFEPQGGRILIDGQNVSDVTWDSVNEAIAEVQQMPGVFHRAVRDNIRYSKPEADEAVVVSAAKDAHAHDFIAGREFGYDTIVGEQGIKLSGGERQRVAIARALVKDAKILVLDEATSSLDSESEHLIQEALFELMRGRTVIAIAHRLSTIVGMDRIVYLEDGRIVEQGSHAELLARGGAYALLWNRQVGGFIDAA